MHILPLFVPDSIILIVIPLNAGYWLSVHRAIYGLPESASFVPVEPKLNTLQRLRTLHDKYGHSAVGALQRLATPLFWHPFLELLAQEVVLTCPECSVRVPHHRIEQLLTPVPPLPLLEC